MKNEIRKLASQLAESSKEGGGARLGPESVVVALSALRAYVDKLPFLEVRDSPELFRIELADSLGSSGQVLAIIRDPILARAAFDAARRQHPGRKVVLGRGQMSEPV
jgi:hypothetical protein